MNPYLAAMTQHPPLHIVLPQDVARRLKEAVQTLCLLPMPRNARPAQLRAHMPEPLIDFWALWNGLSTDERERMANDFNETRVLASQKAVTRMDEVLEWLYWVKDPRNRKVVTAVAAGRAYRQVARWDGRSHETIRQVWRQACGDIADNLNRPT